MAAMGYRGQKVTRLQAKHSSVVEEATSELELPADKKVKYFLSTYLSETDESQAGSLL